MKRILVSVFTIAISLPFVVAISGCKPEPETPALPDEQDLEALRDKLDATNQEMAEAQKKMKEAAEKAKAERLAKQAAAAKAADADGGAKKEPAASETPATK